MKKFNGKILGADEEYFFVVNGLNIIKYNHQGSMLFSKKLKLNFFDNINLYPKFVSRVFRRGVIGGYSGRNSILLWTRREIVLMNKLDLSILRRDRLRDGRYLLNPCCIQNNEEDIYFFGDYFSNPEKNSCAIWRYGIKGLTKEIDFKDGEINHVHAVIPNNGADLVVLTGDFEDSAAIWKYNFIDKKIVKIVGGKQIYRGCVGYCENGYLYYASDTTSESNAFYAFNLATGQYRLIQNLPASVIYGDYDVKTNILCYSTNLEASLDTRNKWNKWLTRKLPSCFNTDKILVYKFSQNKTEMIFEISPSRLPYRLFQYPSCAIKLGAGFVYISGLSSAGLNNITVQMPINK